MLTLRKPTPRPLTALLLLSLTVSPLSMVQARAPDPEPRAYSVRIDDLLNGRIKVVAVCLGLFGTKDPDLAPNARVRIIHQKSGRSFLVTQFEVIDYRINNSQAYVYEQVVSVNSFWPSGRYDVELSMDRSVTDQNLSNNVLRKNGALSLRMVQVKPPQIGMPQPPPDLKPRPKPKTKPEPTTDTPTKVGPVTSLNKILKGGRDGKKVLKLAVRVGDRVVMDVDPGRKYRNKPLKLTVIQADGTGKQKQLLKESTRIEIKVTAAGTLRLEFRKLRNNGYVHIRADVHSQ